MMGVQLTDDAYALYARLAARKGVTVSQYLDDAIKAQARPKNRAQTMPTPPPPEFGVIHMLVDTGRSNEEIARMLDLTIERVNAIRLWLGLLNEREN